MYKKILIQFFIFFILLISPLRAEQFTSIEKFSFKLPNGYEIFNKVDV